MPARRDSSPEPPEEGRHRGGRQPLAGRLVVSQHGDHPGVAVVTRGRHPVQRSSPSEEREIPGSRRQRPDRADAVQAPRHRAHHLTLVPRVAVGPRAVLERTAARRGSEHHRRREGGVVKVPSKLLARALHVHVDAGE